MKTQLKNIVKLFGSKNGDPEEFIINKAFNSIKDFDRKAQLIKSYKELEELNEFYNKENQKIVKDIILEECKILSNKKGKEVKPEDIGNRIPDSRIEDFQSKMNELLETEVTIENEPNFTFSELKESNKLSVSELVKLEIFINE